MEAESSSSMKRVKGGEYLGDISALCILKLPSSFSPFPFLLAGTGSHIVLFDVAAGADGTAAAFLKSFCVFDGVRVHLIAAAAQPQSQSSSSVVVTFTVAVSGERRLKLFTLQLHLSSSKQVSAKLTLLHTLPTFSHCLLHLSFLNNNSSIAIGSSDNSLHVWDISHSNFIIYHLQCPERCLLYSVAIFGHSLDNLLIASGTIFNQIVVWKLVCPETNCHLTTNEVGASVETTSGDTNSSEPNNYEAHVVSSLSGHQGSIFCLSWSSDATKLVSVSDDRSARIWIAVSDTKLTDDSTKPHGTLMPGPILFGHGARVWDCCISDSLIVTAGEDCTCRLWGLDGRELGVIKEHTGRGIWRCLYDPYSSLLFTAGFDSAIKVNYLPTSSVIRNKSVEDVNERKVEVFKVCIPNSSGPTGLMDSKSEYVRCLKFARKYAIYVATNHGCLYYATLSESGSVAWTELVRSTEDIPIICLDLLARDPSELSLEVEDWVAIGDGRGSMKVIRVLFCDGIPKVAALISWSAEAERQLLGTYWCKSLGCRFIFTSNPMGLVKLWKLSTPSSDTTVTNYSACLVADFLSPFGARILSLDASFEEEMLVCGDVRGNLVLFSFLKSMLLYTLPIASEDTSPSAYFKGAHGICSVSSISISRFSSHSAEICSTGGDGCICYLEYYKDRRTLEFVGMRQTKELSLVQSVSADCYSLDDSAHICYAVGFSSTDFLIWNLVSETKVLRVKCGGWRRPHSYYVDIRPEIYSSFAYVKDETIFIHRYWAPDGENKKFPRNLHIQFHGREIHSLCIIPEELRSESDEMLCPKSSWIATGCEDGTVRLTRYDHDSENWAMSSLLGEHVGGSAVRSLCFVSKIHSSGAKVVKTFNELCENNDISDNVVNQSLLISVGAKRVLTSWLLKNRLMTGGDSSAHELKEKDGRTKSSLGGVPAISFKWLSSDMPVKSVHGQKKAKHPVRSLDAAKSISGSMDLELTKPEDAHDNDWRYLAVTAFLVNLAESRLTVCFVVVACSDATLTLRALVLPYRYWFDVASLAPLPSPVLSLQHAVTPLRIPSNQGIMFTKNIYILVSGSTDGSIAFWDLTENIEAFLERASSLHVDKAIDFQKRPRTGRGSQGGRWWKSVDAVVTAKTSGACQPSSEESASSDNVVERSPASPSLKGNQPLSEGNHGDFFLNFFEIKPLHVLHNVHQSGVNCLHLCCHELGNSTRYSIISGGDDQALNFLQVVVAPPLTRSNVVKIENGDKESQTTEQAMHCHSNQSYSIKFLSQKKAISAHSSAVKGVWTDSIWAFSTGLDQRVRCWNHQKTDDVSEGTHFITSVPEPEALDVRACGRNRYQVVVAGRGMQMIEISVPAEQRESS